MPLTRGFFAYPSQPASVGETIRTACKRLATDEVIAITPWEQANVAGRFIIQEICRAIDEVDVFCADLTGANPNVMFELGYAIAKDRRVWLILDTTVADARKELEQFPALTTLGYAPYANSGDIVSRFASARPDIDPRSPILEEYILPNVTTTETRGLLYLKSLHSTEASVSISRRVGRSPLTVTTDDPLESPSQTLVWYGTKVHEAAGLLCDLPALFRAGAKILAARYAFVSGMAFGLGRDVLILAEGAVLSPIDYRDLAKQYGTGPQALQALEPWLERLEAHEAPRRASIQAYKRRLKLASELKGLQLGEYIAENEAEELVNEYFLETAAYIEAREGHNTLFVGRKGTGKSANFLKLADELREDARNSVCVIKPIAYQLDGVVQVVSQYTQRDAKGYLIESLWKLLLYSEVARQLAIGVRTRPPGAAMSGAERDLLAFLDEHRELEEEFAVRLERSVTPLLAQSVEDASVERNRAAISEGLHRGLLGRLSALTREAIRNKRRVVILIDNLDKNWDRASDISVLSEVLLGLLSAGRRVSTELRGEGSARGGPSADLVVFLREDIFQKVREVAREPDKLMYSRIRWDDPELLLRVVEERFVAAHEGDVSPNYVWERYFVPDVNGVPTRAELVRSILPRPRDLLFLVKAAISVAVNRGHVRIDESDLTLARHQYSQYALETLVVEGEVAAESPEAMLYEFVGAEPVLSREDVHQRLRRVGIGEDACPAVVARLCGLGFLGMEIGPGEFRFFDAPDEYRKTLVLARNFREKTGTAVRYSVHRAFRPFLEIAD